MKRTICSKCQRPIKVCYCHTVKPIDNRWPVHIFQHVEESKHPLGTARIAELSLSSCEMQVGNVVTSAMVQAIGREPVLVYPGNESVALSDVIDDGPRTLVFLDASWRKSRRMLHESEPLGALQKVSIDSNDDSRYLIRKSPGKGYLSTLEAIVSALGLIEGDSEKFSPLLKTMDYMIERQIELMGRDVFERNYCRDKD